MLHPLEIRKGKLPDFKNIFRAKFDPTGVGKWVTLSDGGGWQYKFGRKSIVRVTVLGSIVPEGTFATRHVEVQDLISQLLNEPPTN